LRCIAIRNVLGLTTATTGRFGFGAIGLIAISLIAIGMAGVGGLPRLGQRLVEALLIQPRIVERITPASVR
jgi:hypothetical protein